MVLDDDRAIAWLKEQDRDVVLPYALTVKRAKLTGRAPVPETMG